ncbi:MAG: type II secretion system F family protein [Thermoguttaceae bacterium]
MSNTESPQPSGITLDELIALNAEITSLVRAGVPLEPALTELGHDLPGRLGQIAQAVAQRSSLGEPLSKIVSEQSAGWPPMYRAVVEAGLKTGRLPAALEALAGSVRRIAETRRSVGMAMLYPLMLLLLAWAFFAMFAGAIAPNLLSGFRGLDVPGGKYFEMIAHAGRSAGYWGPAGPIVILLLAAFWWHSSGRAGIVESPRSGRLLGCMPWTARLLRCSRVATFAEVLALLVENRVPLHEAIPLAAQASGGRETVAEARRIADALKRGEPLRGRGDSWSFPPLLCWLMATGGRHDALLPALQHAAETYRRRARRQADMLRMFLPVVMIVGIGGTAVLAYTLALFLPYAAILHELGRP